MTTDATIADAVPDDEHKAVSAFELFFDLVFVYAFTQVTALMAADPTWQGLARGALCFAALWWAWGAYAWTATSTDLDEGLIRIGTIGVMCAMLVVGIATPGAFEDEALAFGIAYAIVRILHVGLYALSALGSPELLHAVLGLVPGTLITSTAVIAAAWFDDWVAMAMWAGALAVEYAAPYIIDPAGWTVNAAHFAERFGLILIIALGESLIALGAGVGDHALTLELSLLGALGVVAVAMLWWTYFDVVALVAERHMGQVTGRERNTIARDSYTYLHLPMVLGVILFALGVKKTMSYPHEALKPEIVVALYGGVVMYLLAHVGFRLRNVGSLNQHRLVASALLVVLAATIGTQIDASASLVLITTVLCCLVAYEVVRFREARHRVRHQGSS